MHLDLEFRVSGSIFRKLVLYPETKVDELALEDTAQNLVSLHKFTFGGECV